MHISLFTTQRQKDTNNKQNQCESSRDIPLKDLAKLREKRINELQTKLESYCKAKDTMQKYVGEVWRLKNNKKDLELKLDEIAKSKKLVSSEKTQLKQLNERIQRIIKNLDKTNLIEKVLKLADIYEPMLQENATSITTEYDSSSRAAVTEGASDDHQTAPSTPTLTP